jgi:hypothetical protein
VGGSPGCVGVRPVNLWHESGERQRSNQRRAAPHRRLGRGSGDAEHGRRQMVGRYASRGAEHAERLHKAVAMDSLSGRLDRSFPSLRTDGDVPRARVKHSIRALRTTRNRSTLRPFSKLGNPRRTQSDEVPFIDPMNLGGVDPGPDAHRSRTPSASRLGFPPRSKPQLEG